MDLSLAKPLHEDTWGGCLDFSLVRLGARPQLKCAQLLTQGICGTTNTCCFNLQFVVICYTAREN